MSDEATSKAVLKYLSSNDEVEVDGFRSLTTIFEKVVGPFIPHADSYDLDDEIESKETLRALLDEMVTDGLLESHWGERDYEANYRITDQGSYESAGFDQLIVDLPANVLTTESGEPLTTENGDFLTVEDEVGEAPRISVDSATWTGLPKTGLLNEQQVARLLGGLKLIDKAIDSFDGSNEERAQARAYYLAMHALAAAPEPPADLIWQILQRANNLAGIASLFVSLIALFQAAAH